MLSFDNVHPKMYIGLSDMLTQVLVAGCQSGLFRCHNGCVCDLWTKQALLPVDNNFVIKHNY